MVSVEAAAVLPRSEEVVRLLDPKVLLIKASGYIDVPNYQA